MKRLLILVAVLGLALGSVSTATAKDQPRTQRTVQGSYGPYPAPVTGCNDVLSAFACMHVSTRGQEAFFTAEVKDTHGLPVYVQVYDRYGYLGEFCGRTSKPMKLGRGAALRFFVGLPVWGVQFTCPQHSVKTTGTIRVTLSNRP